MRRIATACAATTAVVLLLIVAASGGAAKEDGKLQLTLKAKTLVITDTGPAGDSPGDIVTGTDTVFRRGRAIGRASSYCIGIEGTAANARLECEGTLVLPRGRIVTHHELITKGETLTSVGAITGGTGIYRQARGEATLRADNLQVARLTLNLTK